MAARPQTSIEYGILCRDLKKGVVYSSFEDFWDKRMEPMQFVPKDAKGALKDVRDSVRAFARTQYDLHSKHFAREILAAMQRRSSASASVGAPA